MSHGDEVVVVVVVVDALPRGVGVQVGNDRSSADSVAVVGSNDIPQGNGGGVRSRSSPGAGSAPACLCSSRASSPRVLAQDPFGMWWRFPM